MSLRTTLTGVLVGCAMGSYAGLLGVDAPMVGLSMWICGWLGGIIAWSESWKEASK